MQVSLHQFWSTQPQGSPILVRYWRKNPPFFFFNILYITAREIHSFLSMLGMEQPPYVYHEPLLGTGSYSFTWVPNTMRAAQRQDLGMDYFQVRGHVMGRYYEERGTNMDLAHSREKILLQENILLKNQSMGHTLSLVKESTNLYLPNQTEVKNFVGSPPLKTWQKHNFENICSDCMQYYSRHLYLETNTLKPCECIFPNGREHSLTLL